ncbi:hypothetical protein IMCC1989_1133 [gamma proteobacterium IMCC1989]|nr:hypothetical protein IMCC1989_1133 [gamma proteobacterium IMCC1989]
MSNQIKPSVTTPKIADIYQDIESGKLVLRPDFQRKFVWTQEHQEEFIETILGGFPFPEIYVCEGSLDTKKLKTTQHVIDGQQRLTTIKNYIENTFKNPLKKVSPFEILDEEKRIDFLGYNVVFRDIGKVEEDVVREVFRRINLTKFKLEDVEIHNAVYDGEFIKTAKEIIKNVSLEKYGVFHESEFTRMADLHFILLIMSTLSVGGYFNRDTEIEKSIAKYNEEFLNANHLKSSIIKAFAIIEDLDLPLDSIWFRKSCFFTLAVEICQNLSSIPSDFKEKLEQFDLDVFSNKDNSGSDFQIFYSYMYAGTTGRKARIERARIFGSNILGVESI